MASGIVSQILSSDMDNFEYWRACMENYLVSKDLCDISETTPTNPAAGHDHEAEYKAWKIKNAKTTPPNPAVGHDHEAECKAWKIKNAKALHAILNSCSPDMFPLLSNIWSAEMAWKTLLGAANSPRKSSLPSASQAVVKQNYPRYADLQRHVHRGDFNSALTFIKGNPEVLKEKISSFKGTALHMATRARNVEIVKFLAENMSTDALMLQDDTGNTALHLAAAAGITIMARVMLKANDSGTLIAVQNEKGFSPLTLACVNGHREATLYLFSQVPFQLLSVQNQNGIHGSELLQSAISSKMFDLALQILHRCPSLDTTTAAAINSTALWALAASPDLFPSGCHLRFWQQWIYYCIHVQSPATAVDVNAHILNQSQPKSKIITQPGIKEIYDLKNTHAYSSRLLHYIFEQASRFDQSTWDAIGMPAFSKAIELGIVEFIVAMARVYPMALYTDDADGRSPMMLSIINRQDKVFNLFRYYGLAAYGEDRFGNTVLHCAGMLSPSSPLSRISGAALQMQRELQWYKKTETMIQVHAVKFNCNKNGKTAAQVFTKNHKQLVMEGEQWMKSTATSCTVVGALIMTLMFTAAFTLPGGNDQDIGIPIFLRKNSFKTFIIADAVSLFSSSTSVMMSLGILTSCCREQDFLISLPRKLIIGLSTLFISIVAMMIAFCAALIVMLDGKMQLIIPIVSLACVPVTLFMFLEFPLLVEIFWSTYGTSIFKTSTVMRFVRGNSP